MWIGSRRASRGSRGQGLESQAGDVELMNRHGKMADGTSRAGNALQKRQESLKRWKGSETDRQPVDRSKKKAKIKFNSGIVFLSAVSSGDVDEVKKLLAKGTDINFQNVDGLTALHQVCNVQLWTSGFRHFIWKVSVAVGLVLNVLGAVLGG